MDPANSAGGEDLDSSQMGSDHRRCDGRRACRLVHKRGGNVGSGEFADTARISEIAERRLIKAYPQHPIDHSDGLLAMGQSNPPCA